MNEKLIIAALVEANKRMKFQTDLLQLILGELRVQLPELVNEIRLLRGELKKGK